MKTVFKKSFTRDLKKVGNRTVNKRIAEAIEQVEQANTLFDVASSERLQGGGEYYRIRIGSYRIGLKVDGDEVIFVRVLHRKDIYTENSGKVWNNDRYPHMYG